MMDNKEIAKKLTSLVQLDIDAVEAYEQALQNIDVSDIQAKISGFRDDHLRHIQEVGAVIAGLGEEPPELKKDLKGFLIQGFTAIRSATGTKGALKAMETNEKLTNSIYHSALEWSVPADIKMLISKNYQDEQKHLAYIQTILSEGRLE